jgi:hypothetical protein
MCIDATARALRCDEDWKETETDMPPPERTKEARHQGQQ